LLFYASVSALSAGDGFYTAGRRQLLVFQMACSFLHCVFLHKGAHDNAAGCCLLYEKAEFYKIDCIVVYCSMFLNPIDLNHIYT